MWIVCGIISVLFLLLNWILTIKKNRNRYWAMACSLIFTVLTLLMEYRLVLQWVSYEDWTALSDVVPTMFSALTGYVIIMIFGNALPLFFKREK